MMIEAWRGRERDQRGPKTISDLEDGGSCGYAGVNRGGRIGHVPYSTVGGRGGEAGRPLGMDRSSV